VTFIFYIVKLTKISNASCLDKMTIPVGTILYLSLYYLVDDLVHWPNPHITCLLYSNKVGGCISLM